MKQVEGIVRRMKLPEVKSADKEKIRKILQGILLFDPTYPKLEFSIARYDGYYTVDVRGWKDEFFFKKWYERFEGPKRDAAYSIIDSVRCIACPEHGPGPLMQLTIGKVFADDLEYDDKTREGGGGGASPARRYRPGQPFFSADAKVAEIVHDMELPSVKPQDLPHMQKLIKLILTFDKTMPRLDFRVIRKADHYNLCIRGWTLDFSTKKWYELFDWTQRPHICRIVEETSCVRDPEDSEGRRRLLKFRIPRSRFQETRRGKKRYE